MKNRAGIACAKEAHHDQTNLRERAVAVCLPRSRSRWAEPVRRERIFTVTYDVEVAPRAIGRAFKVALRMKSGEVQAPADTKDLEAKFEAVAQGSMVK